MDNSKGKCQIPKPIQGQARATASKRLTRSRRAGLPVNSVPECKKAKVAKAVDDDVFQVQEIRGHRINPESTIEYLIKWVGYPESDNTWERMSNMAGCSELLKMYQMRNKVYQVETEPWEGIADGSSEKKYEILDQCPKGKSPRKMLGAAVISGRLAYLIEWQLENPMNKKTKESESATAAPDRVLILSKPFQLKYPAIVIQYYEKHVQFDDDVDD